MKKILRPKDVLLLGLAGVLDVFEEIKDPGGIAATGAKLLYGWVPPRYKRHNFRRVVQLGLRTGEIERIIKGGEGYLRLTSVGKERIQRDFPLVNLQNSHWDGRWRVVIYDISEINKTIRETLRLKLKELGFGMLQESVWVTPFDIGYDFREFLEAKKLGAVVFVLEVGEMLVGNLRNLVDKIWNLEEINDAYLALVTVVEETNRWFVMRCGRKIKPTNSEKGELEKKVVKIRQKYLEVLLRDPCLPKELLPENWAGEKARKEIKKLNALG